ncbi:MAG: hypothetical protein ABSA39_11630 [Edaphobacter sp.]
MGLMWRVCGFSLVAVVVSGHAAFGQTAKSKSASAAKPGMAVWSPEVQQTLGVAEQNFKAEGLNNLTKMQLVALLASARIDPRRQILTCPASGTMSGGRIHVLVTVTGDDPTGDIATSIKQAVGAMNGVDLVDSAAKADKVLHLVVEKMTTGRGTIGFVASYLTATPCTSESAGKKTDVELKGSLGTGTAVKVADLAKDLTTMLDHDLQPLRSGTPQ